MYNAHFACECYHPLFMSNVQISGQPKSGWSGGRSEATGMNCNCLLGAT